MTEYRGLLTDREREILSGDADVTANYLYQVRSRVRAKIDRMLEDVMILDANHPDLLEELERVVCADP